MSAIQSSADSIGEQLRNARQRLSLTSAQVAERLHLPKRIVDAIELNEFTRYPGVTFMRGYLFSYVRLLGLSETQFAEAFADLGLEMPSRNQSLHPPLYRKKPSIAERYLFGFTTLIALLLVTLVGLWWRGHSIDENEFKPQAAAQQRVINKVGQAVGLAVKPPVLFPTNLLPALNTFSAMPTPPLRGIS